MVFVCPWASRAAGVKRDSPALFVSVLFFFLCFFLSLFLSFFVSFFFFIFFFSLSLSFFFFSLSLSFSLPLCSWHLHTSEVFLLSEQPEGPSVDQQLSLRWAVLVQA